MRRYLFSIAIDPVEMNRVYEKIPLHCTLMQWFDTEMGVADLLKSTYHVFQGERVFPISSGAPALFGAQEDVSVYVLEKNERLWRIHMNLFRALTKIGVRFLSPQWVGNGFRAHVTTQGNQSFPTGSAHSVHSIWIFEAITTNQSHKQALVNIRLW